MKKTTKKSKSEPSSTDAHPADIRTGPCGVPGCKRDAVVRGVCDLHFKLYRKHLDLKTPAGKSASYDAVCKALLPPPAGNTKAKLGVADESRLLKSGARKPKCAVTGCGRPATTRGICNACNIFRQKHEKLRTPPDSNVRLAAIMKAILPKKGAGGRPPAKPSAAEPAAAKLPAPVLAASADDMDAYTSGRISGLTEALECEGYKLLALVSGILATHANKGVKYFIAPDGKLKAARLTIGPMAD